MKKSIIFSLSCAVLTSSLYAAPEKLRVVGAWGGSTLYKEYEKPFWKKEFKKDFANTKVRISSAEQIKLKGAAVYRELAKGSFDVVSTVGDYVVSDSQAIAGLDFPTMANDIDTAKKVVDAYSNTLDEVLKKDFNSKLISVVPFPAQVLFCKNEITSLKDLKAKKVRASDWTVSTFLDGIGASGVTMSFGEVPQALQRGVIDCAVTAGLNGYLAGWGEVSEFFYPLQIGGWDYVITAMNLDTWNKFSKEEQEKILSSFKNKVTSPAWAKSDYETKEGEKCLTGQDCSYGKANDMKLVTVLDSDKALSKEVLINTVIPQWSEKVSPEIVKSWNDSIGKVVNITAK